jgi:hypothetical protein
MKVVVVRRAVQTIGERLVGDHEALVVVTLVVELLATRSRHRKQAKRQRKR